MKNTKLKYSLIYLSLLTITLGSCKKDFLEKPPTDAIVDANFYKTDEQVMAGTSLLYSKVWFDYNDKASFNIGDFRAGTVVSAYNYQDNVRFNTTGVSGENIAAWQAFYAVVGQSNLAIININKYAGSGVSPEIKKHAIAEARFMRAVAYRYLVMNWGAVPIIQNQLLLLSDTTTSRNTVASVWKFITKEMREVANDLPSTPDAVGRVTKWSAEGMLARFYLTRAGVVSNGSGVRDQTFLDSAKYYAEDVIKNSGKSLLTNYADLFHFPFDNNNESLFELQWVYSGPDAWGSQNSMPAYIGYSGDIANGDGWGGDISATWWMLSQYDGIVPSGDTLMKGRTVDKRLHETFMLPGAYYPEITQSTHNPEGEQKLVYPYNNSDNNSVAIKKYICGKAKDMGGLASQQHYDYDTYMMRLAEMYLIYAEAAIGNSASTNDATALEYFNKVHTRAGLAPYSATDPNTGAPTPLTLDVVQKERFIEFAMEGMAWYDLVSLHYYNPAKAYSILNSQDRGLFACIPDVFPNPTTWTFRKTPWATTNRTVSASSGNFTIPIPDTELSQAPNLRKPPVDY